MSSFPSQVVSSLATFLVVLAQFKGADDDAAEDAAATNHSLLAN
jgi:hypothetical protein